MASSASLDDHVLTFSPPSAKLSDDPFSFQHLSPHRSPFAFDDAAFQHYPSDSVPSLPATATSPNLRPDGNTRSQTFTPQFVRNDAFLLPGIPPPREIFNRSSSNISGIADENTPSLSPTGLSSLKSASFCDTPSRKERLNDGQNSRAVLVCSTPNAHKIPSDFEGPQWNSKRTDSFYLPVPEFARSSSHAMSIASRTPASSPNTSPRRYVNPTVFTHCSQIAHHGGPYRALWACKNTISNQVSKASMQKLLNISGTFAPSSDNEGTEDSFDDTPDSEAAAGSTFSPTVCQNTRPSPLQWPHASPPAAPSDLPNHVGHSQDDHLKIDGHPPRCSSRHRYGTPPSPTPTRQSTVCRGDGSIDHCSDLQQSCTDPTPPFRVFLTSRSKKPTLGKPACASSDQTKVKRKRLDSRGQKQVLRLEESESPRVVSHAAPAAFLVTNRMDLDHEESRPHASAKGKRPVSRACMQSVQATSPRSYAFQVSEEGSRPLKRLRICRRRIERTESSRLADLSSTTAAKILCHISSGTAGDTMHPSARSLRAEHRAQISENSRLIPNSLSLSPADGRRHSGALSKCAESAFPDARNSRQPRSIHAPMREGQWHASHEVQNKSVRDLTTSYLTTSAEVSLRTSAPKLHRSFPSPIEKEDVRFPGFYQRYHVPSHLPEETKSRVFPHGPRDASLPPSLQAVARRTFSSVPGTANDAFEDPFSLYVPRFTRGTGLKKEALCPICYDTSPSGEGCFSRNWYQTKVSAYNYHLQIVHGIMPATGRPMDPPVAFRTVDRIGIIPIGERATIVQGKCHACGKWVALESVKDLEVKIPEIYWRKHAGKCHKNRPMAGTGGIFVEDENLVPRQFYHRVKAACRKQTD